MFSARLKSLSKSLRLALALITAAGLLWAGPAAAFTFKVATWAPEGTTWLKEMRKAGEEIKQRTDGRVEIKYYPGGVMGNDSVILRKMRIGQLHGGAFASTSLKDIYPDAQLYSLPLLFRSYGEVDYVRSRMDDTIRQGLERNGFVTLGISEGGFAYLMSQVPIEGVEDLQERKIWVPEGDTVNIRAFENAGVSPTPLPFADVYTALQTGLLDSAVNLPTAVIAFQWHTKLSTLTDLPLSYVIGVFVVDKRAFSRVDPADQKVMREVMNATFNKLNDLNRKDNKNAKEALKTQGFEFYDFSDEDVKRFRQNAAQAIDSLADEDQYTPALLAKLRAYLKEFRDKNPNAKQF